MFLVFGEIDQTPVPRQGIAPPHYHGNGLFFTGIYSAKDRILCLGQKKFGLGKYKRKKGR